MTWWHWLVLGLALVALEMAAAGGFYIIFFGVAALLVAALYAVGITGPLWLQALLFSVFSVGSLMFFRNRLLRMLKIRTGPTDIDALVGEVGTTLDDIDAGAVGRVELRGSMWTARNAGSVMLDKGRRCIVVRRDELMLFVRAEEAA